MPDDDARLSDHLSFEQVGQDRIVLAISGMRTLLDPLHVAFGLVAHGRANGGIHWNGEVVAVSKFIRDAAQMLTLLGLDTMCIEVA